MLAKIPIVLSRARHTRLPFNRAAAIYRLRSMGCQGVRARIEHLETSLNFTEIGTKAGRVPIEHFATILRDDYALCPLQEGAAGVSKSNLLLYGDEMVCYTQSLFRKKMKR